ncbi:hypothetical protein Tco_0531507 [Tanacetum coccineum]
MSSTTAQQTKLDLELICPRVPGKDFDALPSEEDTVSFLRELGHTREINSLNDVVIDQMHQPWRTFDALINRDIVELLWEDFIYQIENRVYKKKEKIYYPRFTKAIIHHFLIQEKTLSWRNKIGMHTSKDDYLINFLRFVSTKESTQIYGAILPECLTSPVMKESKAYKTYLGYAIGVMKNLSRKVNALRDLPRSLQLSQQQVSSSERLLWKQSLKVRKKEKVDVTRGKGIEFLSEVALTEEAQMKEVRKKSLRDFHKTHPSGSGVPDVIEDDSTESESKSWLNDEDGNNNEQESKQEEESEDDDQEEDEFVHTPTDDEADDNLESESDDVIKKPTQSDKEIVQGEGVDAEMNDVQQGNENLETTQEQVVEDAHVTISTVMKKTEVLVTSSSRSSDLASKFLKFLDIPHADAEIVSPLDVHVHHEVPRTQAPTFLKIPVSVITKSSPVYTNIPQSSQTFTPPPILTTPNLQPTIETTNPLSTLPDFALVFRFNDRITTLEKEVDILPKEVSNFAPLVIEKLIKESRDEVTLAKVSSQPHSTYEAASTLTEFELKKILIGKIEKSKSYLAAPEHQDCYDSLKKSYDLNKEFFFSYDVYSLKHGRKDKDKDEDPFAGSDRGLKKRKTRKDVEPTTCPKNKDSTSSSSKGTKSQPKPSSKSTDCSKKPTPPQEPTDPDWHEGKTPQKGPTQKWLMTLAASTSTDKSLKDFDELMSTPIDFSRYILNGLKIKNLTQEILLGPAFRLLKGTRSNYAELEYDFEECYKALSEKLDWENPEGGDYPFDLSKPLPLITRRKRQRVPFEYFINNDLKYLQGGVLTMTHTTSTTKTKAAQYDLPGIEDMVLNIWSPVMRKHGYGYMEEIVVRRADNVLYRFKEVEDLQLRVESYQKQINVTKPHTTRPYLRKRHPYTPYKDPQGFIYVDDFKRNRLMRSDELYKFSDGTLTRLLSSLKDITKNIDMEYLPKRRWSTLEKKRAHFIIKDINKLLKERRMMRSLEKFVGGRIYGTDLRLLQRTI